MALHEFAREEGARAQQERPALPGCAPVAAVRVGRAAADCDTDAGLLKESSSLGARCHGQLGPCDHWALCHENAAGDRPCGNLSPCKVRRVRYDCQLAAGWIL
jgi:hypothetical protein